MIPGRSAAAPADQAYESAQHDARQQTAARLDDVGQRGVKLAHVSCPTKVIFMRHNRTSHIAGAKAATGD